MLTMLEALDVANGCRMLEIGTGSGYDRIIATCFVAVIPPVWLEQVVPGGVIMTDVRGQLGGTVVRLTMNDDGTASGRFLPCYVSFMSPPLSPSSTSGIDQPDSAHRWYLRWIRQQRWKPCPALWTGWQR